MCPLLSAEEKARAVAMFDSYCKMVIVNRIRNHLKGPKHARVEVLVPLPEKDADYRDEEGETYELTHGGVTVTFQRKALFEVFKQLKWREAMVLILKFWQNDTDAAIAQQLHVTTRTVRNLKTRAYAHIQKELMKREKDHGTHI